MLTDLALEIKKIQPFENGLLPIRLFYAIQEIDMLAMNGLYEMFIYLLQYCCLNFMSCFQDCARPFLFQM